MENNSKQYKRQYREQSPETRQKISNAMKNRPKPDSVRQSISNGLKTYWQGVEHRPEQDYDGGFEDVM